MEACSAIALFQQSARRVRQDFALAGQELPHVVRICQLVEGMPLAIELAAAGTAVCALRDIAQDIEHNLDVLSTSMRNVPARHRSVRATLLIHKSLLRCDATGRYQFHQLLRQFAAEKLAELPPQTQTTQHRHADYYVAFLIQQEEALKRHFQDSMAIYSKTEDGWGTANVLNNLCLVAHR